MSIEVTLMLQHFKAKIEDKKIIFIPTDTRSPYTLKEQVLDYIIDHNIKMIELLETRMKLT